MEVIKLFNLKKAEFKHYILVWSHSASFYMLIVRQNEEFRLKIAINRPENRFFQEVPKIFQVQAPKPQSSQRNGLIAVLSTLARQC